MPGAVTRATWPPHSTSIQRHPNCLVNVALLDAHLGHVHLHLHALRRRHGGAELCAQRGGGAEETRVARDAAEGFEEARRAPAVAELPVDAQAVLERTGAAVAAAALHASHEIAH